MTYKRSPVSVFSAIEGIFLTATPVIVNNLANLIAAFDSRSVTPDGGPRSGILVSLCVPQTT
jgi:hypothetical protein